MHPPLDASRPQTITFREAYASIVKDPYQARKPLVENKTLEAINDDLIEFIDGLEKEPRTALSSLKKIIPSVSNNMASLSSWTDTKGYDLLHHAIMNKRPEIIHYLLRDLGLFPTGHRPKLNPYAHMAASTGFKDCLEAVIQYRPTDFFKTCEPQHSIRLPTALMQRLKLHSTGGMADKHVNQIMKCVKEEMTMAEMKIRNKTDKSEQASFEDELKNLQSSFNEKSPKTHKRRSYSSTSMEKLKGTEKTARASPLKGTHKSLDPISSSSEKGAIKTPNKDEEGKKGSKSKSKKAPKTSGKITLYWDVFKDDSSSGDCGVLGGAGERIHIVHAENYDDKKTLPSLSVNPVEKNIKFKTTAVPKSKKSHQNHPDVKKKSAADFTSPSSATLNKQAKKTASNSDQQKASITKVELGIRKIKKYKDFFPVIEHKVIQLDDYQKHMNKTPLTMAAERGHLECVKYLLETFYLRDLPPFTSRDALTLATSARSPEAIAAVMEKKVSTIDYQNAILLAIQEMYPDCLNILLSMGGKERNQIFDRTNLFHILYTQSLNANYRYEMLPEMTRILISRKEDTNARNTARTYPLYTLIKCAFNVTTGETSTYFLACLKMLLSAHADPHYNEARVRRFETGGLLLSRPAYTSAIQCVFVNAKNSLKYFEKPFWAQIIMHRFVKEIEASDRTGKLVSNDILFVYMEHVCSLGLNRRILRTLLRYGANPDHEEDGKYPLNMFFELTIQFLTKFQVIQRYVTYDDMLITLLILCKAMSPECLYKSIILFLDMHLLSTPLQALDITRKFCYHANKMITSPRTLAHIASLFLWKHLGRNAKRVRMLPVTEDLMYLILP